jgi:predicted PurR-regulated permease PerM
VFIARKPIVSRRPNFNAIAATILARSNRAESGSRLWIIKYGISPSDVPSTFLLTTALVTSVGVGLYCARRVILIFVFSILFTYLLDPVVKFLQKHSLFFRNLRGPAVVEVYLALVLLIAPAGYWFAPRLSRNTAKVMDESTRLSE